MIFTYKDDSLVRKYNVVEFDRKLGIFIFITIHYTDRFVQNFPKKNSAYAGVLIRLGMFLNYQHILLLLIKSMLVKPQIVFEDRGFESQSEDRILATNKNLQAFQKCNFSVVDKEKLICTCTRNDRVRNKDMRISETYD